MRDCRLLYVSTNSTFRQLRDIFRVHPNTGCNTHDLLECDCDKADEGLHEEWPSETKQRDQAESFSGFVAASEVTDDDLSSIEEAVRINHLSHLSNHYH